MLGIDKFSTDELFYLIRDWSDRTQENSNRLTFCLLGVATPSNLIKDKRQTPFNIGQAIDLQGFTLQEASEPLTRGLVGRVDNPKEILEKVLDWTGGQPFLTQKLCHLVVQQTTNETLALDELVQTQVIENWEATDEPVHLRTIRDRFIGN